MNLVTLRRISFLISKGSLIINSPPPLLIILRPLDPTSNALGHGVGVVLVSLDEQYIPFMTRLGFVCINNVAEYEACALGIQVAIDFKVKLLKIYGDSALVIHQLRGEWKTKDHKLIPYQAYIWKLIEYFDESSKVRVS